MKKFVVKLDLEDDKEKQRKALKTVSTLSGIDEISMDVKGKKLTVIGTVDPVSVVTKLRKKNWDAHILTVGPAKEPEKKKEEPKKEEPKKEEPKKEAAAAAEPKKEEPKKEEAPKKEEEAAAAKKEEEVAAKKKEQEMVVGTAAALPYNYNYNNNYNYRPPYYPPMNTYYYVHHSIDENPTSSCVIC